MRLVAENLAGDVQLTESRFGEVLLARTLGISTTEGALAEKRMCALVFARASLRARLDSVRSCGLLVTDGHVVHTCVFRL